MGSNLVQNVIPLAPEIFLAAVAVVVLLYGVFGMSRVTPLVLLSVLLTLALTMYKVPQAANPSVVAMNGMFIADGFGAFAKLLILGGAVLVLAVSSDWLLEEGGRPFEFLAVMMFSLLGMMLMVSAHDLLALYMGLELSSLGLYVLASFERDSARSTEAGLKYFVLGALASGMMLFGISLVYGFTGTINFEALAEHLSQISEEATGSLAATRAAVVGVVLIIIGLCFKVSAVPFHMWTPDVYEGAPTPVTAFFAVAPKVAAMALFARVLLQPFGDLFPQWQQIIVFVSFASMAVGALAALRQTNLKRLLAYSSIGHAGFMLMGLATGTSGGVQGMLIYLTVYVFMSAGAFGCLLLMRRGGQYVENIADLAGLSRTQPWLAFLLALFMFSMAGIPPTAGFFGKMYVVLPAIEAGLAPLAVIGLLTSVIACYYYLRVVKFMYFDEPAAPFDHGVSPGMRIGLSLTAAVTLLFFMIPAPVITQARAAASMLLQ